MRGVRSGTAVAPCASLFFSFATMAATMTIRNTFVEFGCDNGGARRRCLSASRLPLVALSETPKNGKPCEWSDTDATDTGTPAMSTPRSIVTPLSLSQVVAHLAEELSFDCPSPRTWAPVHSPWASDDEFEGPPDDLPMYQQMCTHLVPTLVHVPAASQQNSGLESQSCGHEDDQWLTAGIVTVMLRNIPNKYSLDLLLTEMEEEGFGDAVDFVYMPIDTDFRVNRGYAFVNFRSPAASLRFRQRVQGRGMRRFRSSKVVRVDRAMVQGFEQNLAKVRSQQGRKF
mmetsp:Transcript_9434/g.23947  ORF Transcript_9434/g.23947 Transcript_9434/m.23947 type:complete len:285 (-) Transcript_9434:2325-3179(-)